MLSPSLSLRGQGGVGPVHGPSRVRLHSSSSCRCLYSYRPDKDFTAWHLYDSRQLKQNPPQLHTLLINGTNKTTNVELFGHLYLYLNVKRESGTLHQIQYRQS